MPIAYVWEYLKKIINSLYRAFLEKFKVIQLIKKIII
jgi:hypothetical protein